jgi:hypothetical protein
MFRMGSGQRMIIWFFWNEGIEADEIKHRLQAQFRERDCALRTVRFWIAEVWSGPQDLYGEIRTRGSSLDDFDVKILSILDKSPSKSARSIAETLPVARSIVLLRLYDSIDFRSFHLH